MANDQYATNPLLASIAPYTPQGTAAAPAFHRVLSGEGGATMDQRGYPQAVGPTFSGLERATALAPSMGGIENSDDPVIAARNANETARLKNAQQTATGGTGLGTVTPPVVPNQFQDDAGFGFRNAIAAARLKPVAPGSSMTMQYGPGVGGAAVRAVAGADGRFNQFSSAPGQRVGGANIVPGLGDVSNVNSGLLQQHVQLLSRINALRASGNPTAGLLIRGLQSQLNNVQSQIAQQQQLAIQGGQLGVQRGDLALRSQVARPGIITGNIAAGLAASGNPDALRKFKRAEGGQTDTTTVGTPFASYVAPNSALETGAVFPGYPGMTPAVPVPWYQVDPNAPHLSRDGLGQ